MFSALENEIVRILEANLSIQASRVNAGPLDEPPSPGQRPQVVITADAFEILPPDELDPPGGVKVAVEDTFPAGDSGPLALSRRPLEPLRAVEVEESGGGRTLLRERDDYTVNYVAGEVTLRRPPEDPVHVLFFHHQPLTVVATAALRIDGRLEIWADAPGALATAAMGALIANREALDGLLGDGQDVPDSGLPSLGARRVFVVYENLRFVDGRQPEPEKWEIRLTVDACLVLVPEDAAVGLIRHIAAAVAWDGRLAEALLSSPPPILERPVTVIRGVGNRVAAALANLGVTTIGQLARTSPLGRVRVDDAIVRARIVRDRTHEVVRTLVRSSPTIPDVAAFLDQRLSSLDAGDLTAVGIPAAAAATILAAFADLLAQARPSVTLRLSDLLRPGG